MKEQNCDIWNREGNVRFYIIINLILRFIKKTLLWNSSVLVPSVNNLLYTSILFFCEPFTSAGCLPRLLVSSAKRYHTTKLFLPPISIFGTPPQKVSPLRDFTYFRLRNWLCCPVQKLSAVFDSWLLVLLRKVVSFFCVGSVTFCLKMLDGDINFWPSFQFILDQRFH